MCGLPVFFRCAALPANGVQASRRLSWLQVNSRHKKTRLNGRVLIEAEPQMEWGRLPAAKQLHQMAEIVVTTGGKTNFEISVTILLPSNVN